MLPYAIKMMFWKIVRRYTQRAAGTASTHHQEGTREGVGFASPHVEEPQGAQGWDPPQGPSSAPALQHSRFLLNYHAERLFSSNLYFFCSHSFQRIPLCLFYASLHSSRD